MLFFGGLVGVLVALASTVMVGREERERMQRQLAELMATVERTASVAAFARDEQLANEVAQGLLLNDAVARVVITEADHVLASVGEADTEAGVLRLPVLVRPLTSPFSPDQQVGELRLWPASSKIAQAAGSYSRVIAIILLIAIAIYNSNQSYDSIIQSFIMSLVGLRGFFLTQANTRDATAAANAAVARNFFG